MLSSLLKLNWHDHAPNASLFEHISNLCFNRHSLELNVKITKQENILISCIFVIHVVIIYYICMYYIVANRECMYILVVCLAPTVDRLIAYVEIL